MSAMALEDIETIPGGARLSCRLGLRNGLHARPAARITREAQRWSSSVRLVCNGAEADARSILDILSLAIPAQAMCTVEATGPDAREAVASIAAILTQDQD